MLPTSALNALLDTMLGWLASVLLGALQLLWDLLSKFALVSPDVTTLPQVRAVSTRSLWVVDTVYVLAVVTAGILVMVRETVQLRYGIADLAPRLLIGLIGANLSLPLCRGLIVAANALTQGLTGDPITADGSLRLLTTTVTSSYKWPGPSPERALLSVVLLMLLALTMMLLVSWLVRVGLLVVLTGISPLALACHGLPQTEAMARLWWRSMLAVLGVVTAQAFALHATLTVFLGPQANLAQLGIPMDRGGTINLVIVACLLWTTVQIPSFARRFVTGGRPSAIATVARVVVVQHVMRGMTRGLLRRR